MTLTCALTVSANVVVLVILVGGYFAYNAFFAQQQRTQRVGAKKRT